MRSLSDRELVVASHNPGKVREIEALLAPHGVRVSSAAKFNLSEPDETGTSFAANAKIKATAACDTTGLAAIADDSGLVIRTDDGSQRAVVYEEVQTARTVFVWEQLPKSVRQGIRGAAGWNGGNSGP